MNAQEFLESESILYNYLSQDVKTLLEFLVVYEWCANEDGDTVELVHTLISIVIDEDDGIKSGEGVKKEDLVTIAKLAPYLSPVAFLRKPCDVNTVFIKVAEILREATQEKLAEYRKIKASRVEV